MVVLKNLYVFSRCSIGQGHGFHICNVFYLCLFGLITYNKKQIIFYISEISIGISLGFIDLILVSDLIVQIARQDNI